jgi:eukaryotic-like serine/threonine-protein kinase
MNFVTELKRRNVFRVGAAYAVIAWFIVQAADIMLDNFGAPGWVFKTVVGLLMLGFPLALFLSWAYELTPDGVKKAEDLAPEEAAEASAPRRRNGSFVWILLLAAAAAAGLTWLAQSNPELPGPQARVSADVQARSKSPTGAGPLFASILAPAGTRINFQGDLAGPPVVSPDGRLIAFVASGADQMRRLWVRALDQPDPRELTGTDGAMFPFWSPDSRELAFFDGRLLRRYDLASDTIITMVAVGSARGGAWTEDGRIIYTNDFRSGLSIVDANGGEPTPLTTLDENLHTSHRWPFVIAGTNQYLFTAITAVLDDMDNNGIYLGTLDSDAPPRRLMASNYSAAWIDGWLLHVRDGVLLATRMDPDSATSTRRPVAIAGDIAADLSIWHGQFSASASGVLALYRPPGSGQTGGQLGYGQAWQGGRVSLFAYNGRRVTSYTTGAQVLSTSLSRDGRKLALTMVSPNESSDLWTQPTGWLQNLDETPRDFAVPPQRLTFLPGSEGRPVWSPEGTELVFRWDGDADNPRGIYRMRIGGGAHTLVRDNQGADDHPSDWTADGRFLIVTTDSILPSDRNDIIAVPLDGGPEISLITEPGPQFNGRVSPDGRWLAYQDTSGISRIYVIPFAPAWPERQRQRKWLVADNGGHMPRWSLESDELFFVTETGTLIAVDIEATADEFSFSVPRVLFQTPWRLGGTYDPTPDAAENPNSFVFIDSDPGPEASISLILNWQALLREEE